LKFNHYLSYLTKFELGVIIGLFSFASFKASSNDKFNECISQATTMAPDLETPALQCTKTASLFSIACLMNLIAYGM